MVPLQLYLIGPLSLGPCLVYIIVIFAICFKTRTWVEDWRTGNQIKAFPMTAVILKGCQHFFLEVRAAAIAAISPRPPLGSYCHGLMVITTLGCYISWKLPGYYTVSLFPSTLLGPFQMTHFKTDICFLSVAFSYVVRITNVIYVDISLL